MFSYSGRIYSGEKIHSHVKKQASMHLNLWLLIQCTVVSVVIVKVTGDTESKNHCSFDQETLWLKITTGNKLFAGTDDDVHVLLLGADGIICRANLDNSGNDRKRNNVDKYTVCCPKGFMNDDREVNMFVLTHMANIGKNGQTVYNDWLIERIELGTNRKVIFNYRLYAWTSSLIQGTVLFSKVDKENFVRF